MSNTRICRTPGATFHIKVTPACIGVEVDLPDNNHVDLSKEQAIELTNQLHDAMEEVLSQFFDENSMTLEEALAYTIKERTSLAYSPPWMSIFMQNYVGEIRRRVAEMFDSDAARVIDAITKNNLPDGERVDLVETLDPDDAERVREMLVEAGTLAGVVTDGPLEGEAS